MTQGADMAAKSFTYQGNPGYVFPGINDGNPLNPGDKVSLSDEQAASVGDEFKPAKGATEAPASDPEVKP